MLFKIRGRRQIRVLTALDFDDQHMVVIQDEYIELSRRAMATVVDVREHLGSGQKP